MAKKRAVDLDWITIRYDDIAKIVTIIIILLVVVGGGFFFWRWHSNPQFKASRALSHAQHLYDSVSPATAKDQKSTLNQARNMIAQGRAEYRNGEYKKALTMAEDVISTLEELDTGQPQKYAVLVETDGSVDVKRIHQHVFTSAKNQMVLEDGDIVRTARDSYAKIKYHTGQVDVITPDSLLVIQAMTTTESGANRIEVFMQKGHMETRTPTTMGKNDESIIRTKSTTVRPGPDSRVGVALGESGKVMTAVMKGVSELEAGGKKETLRAGTSGMSVISTDKGISNPEPMTPPPVPVSPSDQQIFRAKKPNKYVMNFKWNNPSKSEVLFEISARPLFSKMITPPMKIKGTTVSLDGLPAGTYYWRLKASSNDPNAYWSPIYRFRLLRIYERPPVKRKLSLQVDATPLGDGVILQGKTDPGISVSVNDIEIPVNTDGTFSKIYLFTDVGEQLVIVRAFDDDGNETIWKRKFQSVSY